MSRSHDSSFPLIIVSSISLKTKEFLEYVFDIRCSPRATTKTSATSNPLSTLNYFKSKGFSEPDFPRIAFLSLHLFAPTFDPIAIEHVFDFLTVDLAASPEEVRGLILKCPHILESDPELCLKPTLDYLKKLGIKRLNSPTTLNAHLLDTRCLYKAIIVTIATN
ncbi:hypothetical protein L6452_33537 [Arctium lappa]|uniref:Uncharacterized protein n=1 Tax=Arctium lappa TaxID=4217 RepID=A0ACB8YGW8_ARCLA|nr:hypothetical protein L6452_33537 [Arctium lappa]